MIIEKIQNGTIYTLSNENLNPGDKVYPIARGRITPENSFILHELDYRDFISGWPNDPHIVKDTSYSDYKPYQIRTDKGYGPIEKYYKIIKKAPLSKSNLRLRKTK